MIEVDHIVRTFGELKAVDDISFSVDMGEVLGFLGPNGAGKSTTMKIITGFLTSTSGTVVIDGHDIQNNPIQAKSLIGYLPEGAPAYPDMTPLEFLSFIADIRGLEGEHKQERLNYAIDAVHLRAVIHQPIETLSKGFKRRVGLAQAIIHDPKILILDEPTDGLDPNQKHEVRELIRTLAKDKIIIVSTHILEEVSAVCSRTIIIDQGKVVADCSPEALAARSKYYNAVTLKMSGDIDIKGKLESITDIENVEVDTTKSTYTLLPRSGRHIFTEINEIARNENWPLEECYVEKGRLDEVFRTITTEERT